MKRTILLIFLLLLTIYTLAQYKIELDVEQLPELQADAGEGDTLCGLSFNLAANSTTQNGFWEQVSGSGSSVFEPNEYSPSTKVIVSNEGVYSFVWTEDDGICTKTDTIKVGFYDFPTADAGSDQSIDEGESIHIGGNPTATGGSGEFIYTWSPEDGLDNPENSNPLASPPETTDYIVVVKDKNGCKNSDTVTVYVKTITSIGELCSKDVKIYPNPARDKLNIAFANGIQSNYVIKISNPQGHTMAVKELKGNGRKRHTIDLSGLRSGVYFIQLYNSQVSQTWKFIIE
jgi:hypothetical protein